MPGAAPSPKPVAHDEARCRHGRARVVFMMAAAAALCMGACVSDPVAPGSDRSATLERPDPCLALPAGTDLNERLAAVRSGTSLCLQPGAYEGPIVISEPVTIWGPRTAIIRSAGQGTTIDIEANGTSVLGVTVDGSGGRFATLDAAVRVAADDVRVEGVLVRNATFGLLVEKASRVTLVDNVVLGADDGPLGLRGDGVRLSETRDSVVRGNRVVGSRDLVIWYSTGNRVESNEVVRSRYGTHFMYSHDNVVRGNQYIDNLVGVFIMYSRNLELSDNLLARSSGPGGMGLGIKESGNLAVSDNTFVSNTTSVYMDTTPLEPGDVNTFSDNAFYYSEVAVLMHASGEGNAFLGNTFASNGNQLEVEGGVDALGVHWDGNAFDDYAGYDLDRDGFGDVPYELRRLSSQLESTYPQLQFFRGGMTLELLDAVTALFPMVEPKTTLVDPRPRMAARRWRPTRAR